MKSPPKDSVRATKASSMSPPFVRVPVPLDASESVSPPRVLGRVLTLAVGLFLSLVGCSTAFLADPGTARAESGDLESASDLRAEEPRVEYLSSPLGLDEAKPRFSWIVVSSTRGERQSAYRILVASSAEALARGEGDIWDSGKVASDRTAQVVYEGRPLRSRETCHWRVSVWGRDGRSGVASAGARFETGYLSPGEWKGRWIGRTTDLAEAPAPYLRREFEVKGKVRRARAYICGLGYHELRLNGAKVGDHHLDPGYTRYDKRVLSVAHDVTESLREGKNAVGVILGTGWFDVHSLAVWYFDKAPWRAAPKLLLDLWIDYEDGQSEVISSDAEWKSATGPIVYDSIYGGETYDARLEAAIEGWDRPGFADGAWKPVRLVEAPAGQISAQAMPPIRAKRVLDAVKVHEPKPGVQVFDFGENCAGSARIRLSGPAGTRVRLRYGEKILPDGSLDVSNIAVHMVKTDPPQRFQTDEYILSGRGVETWQARFAYHGFQYVEVSGAPGKLGPENLHGLVVHSDVEPRASFRSSNPLLERIWDCTRRAYLANLQGIPTDCPHREKNGWTGDAHLAGEVGLLQFDPALVYAKWVQDLDDEQRKADEGKRHRGELPGIVPTSGWGYDWGNGPAWDSAFLLLPSYLHDHLADTRILERHYEGFKLYVDYLTRRSEGGIVSIGLGDWCPWETETPVAVTSTGYYYRDALIVAKAAGLLGKKEDARVYGALADSIREAFVARFIDPATGACAAGSQTAQACALYQGLVSGPLREKVFARLVEAVEKRGGSLDFGILGSKYVLRALTDGGRTDLAYAMASRKDLPSWGHWLEEGATTLWESWRGVDSRNHIMFGDVSAWFVWALAGIRRDPEVPGFRRVVFRPEPVGDLCFVEAEYRSTSGRIRSRWDRGPEGLRVSVEIPANVTGSLWLPVPEGARVLEGGKPAEESPGVRALERKPAHAVFDLESGNYVFEVR